MDITLTNFQLKAIADLTEAMDKPNREIVLKSCTGSGKTIILTHFMDEYFKSNAKTEHDVQIRVHRAGQQAVRP